jgi:hypothetical protein
MGARLAAKDESITTGSAGEGRPEPVSPRGRGGGHEKKPAAEDESAAGEIVKRSD